MASASALYGCSGGGAGVDGGSDSSTSDVVSNDVVVPQDSGADAGPSQVTFSYTPQWKTVTAVSVYGGFGQTTDWAMPLLALTDDGSGTFTGTATLPAGQYLYVFRVRGDDAADYGVDGGKASGNYERYAIDPGNSAFMPCPAASPTYSMIDKNPCSELTVPQASAPGLVHVKGTVVSGNAPIADYLVVLERNETGSHHFFVNRVTTAGDGKYDLMAAPGQYRLQVQYPSLESKSDVERDPPTALAAVRRLIGSDFKLVSADVQMPDAQVAFGDYPAFAPSVHGVALPTTFTFSAAVKSPPTHLDVYGTGMDGGAPNIGDPWFNSAATTTGTAVFDGGFNTMQAKETSVATGERYFWGVEQDITTDAGVSWVAQSMVFDITWP